jgi:hypothetical protein
MVADKATLIDYDWITFSDALHAKFAAGSRITRALPPTPTPDPDPDPDPDP